MMEYTDILENSALRRNSSIDYRFNQALATDYRSNSQRIRVMSEDWVGRNSFCPCCGNPHISKMANNTPVSDFQCDNCGEIFELKSKSGGIDQKIADGAYSTMIERITSATNPDLFLLRYNSALEAVDLLLIPKFFFVPQIIEKRKPLAPTAKRAGWIGCNILVFGIPQQGRIQMMQNQRIADVESIVAQYAQIKKLQTTNIESRGWLFDVMHCINAINHTEFSLREVYTFAEQLQGKHIANHNIEAKIRQQLQILRDKGFIEFMGKGVYRKLVL